MSPGSTLRVFHLISPEISDNTPQRRKPQTAVTVPRLILFVFFSMLNDVTDCSYGTLFVNIIGQDPELKYNNFYTFKCTLRLRLLADSLIQFSIKTMLGIYHIFHSDESSCVFLFFFGGISSSSRLAT